MPIPQDPIMLLSYVNTKLRDEYESLNELCCELSLSRREIEQRMQSIGYAYSPSQNQFV